MSVRFKDDVQEYDTFTSAEYDRKGEFNPGASAVEWAKEEEAEKKRMLEDRWTYMERNLGGAKCEERIAHEKAIAKYCRKR